MLTQGSPGGRDRGSIVGTMPDNVAQQDDREEDVPAALLYCTDLMFGVQLQNIATRAGFRPVTLKPHGPIPEGAVLVVDLAARGDWEAAIEAAARAGIPVVAFGPHMDAGARKRARAAGASRVLANSNLARDLPTILEKLEIRK